MKLKLLTALVLFAGIGFATPSAVFSQPNKNRPNTYSPGYWQPKGQVNPSRQIKVTLYNASGLPVNYSLNPQSNDRLLAPGGRTDLYISDISRVNDIATINIYSGAELDFDYVSEPKYNQVVVRVRQAGDLARADKSVYIDEAGRVYSF